MIVAHLAIHGTPPSSIPGHGRCVGMIPSGGAVAESLSDVGPVQDQALEFHSGVTHRRLGSQTSMVRTICHHSLPVGKPLCGLVRSARARGAVEILTQASFHLLDGNKKAPCRALSLAASSVWVWACRPGCLEPCIRSSGSWWLRATRWGWFSWLSSVSCMA